MQTGSDQQKISVLVVEDSALQRNHALQLCVQSGVEDLSEACDGEDALAVLRHREQPVDLALVDLEMPGMDGVSLLRKLAKEQRVKSVAIVSSKDPSLIGSVAMMAEADGLTVLGTLHKPLTAEAVGGILRRYREQVVPHTEHDSDTSLSVADILEGLRKREFFLQYQPKVVLRTGLVKGVEALVRWRHPSKGIIAPVHFISLVEKSSLMSELTRFVLEEALQQAQQWQAHGLRLNTAVNLSPLSLENEHLAEWVATTAQRYAVEPKNLTLEITESAVITNVASAISTLAHLRLKGFGVSIDDFGTGHATTQQLSRLPVTELKVDRSLVNGIASKQHLRVILESTLAMGKGLHLCTVAEGIELKEEWDLLLAMGCELGQGYFISRPLDAADLPQWVKTARTRLHPYIPQ